MGSEGVITPVATAAAAVKRDVVQEAQAVLASLGLLATPHARSTANGHSCDGILLLIPGAGHATAAADDTIPCGLWSTAKFASEQGLERGSMQNYVSWALGAQLKPVVLGSHAASAVLSAFDSIESGARAAGRRLPIVVAAHSEGAASLVAFLRDQERWTCGMDAECGIAGVALLDSVHSSKDLPPKGSRGAAWLQGDAVVNWVASDEALDHVKPKPWCKGGIMGGVPVRSAGTAAHLLVPWTACEAACAFLDRRLEAWQTELRASSAAPAPASLI